LALAVLAGILPARPTWVRAATATLSADAPLLDAPSSGGAMLTLLPAGAIVAVDGEAVDGYAPVTAGDLAGWVPSEALLWDDAGGEPATDNGNAATPIAEDAVAAAPAEPSVAAAPLSEPLVTPVLVAEDGPRGPAEVLADSPVLLGPDPAFGLITTAPVGSTVVQTGNLIAGYVTVQFAEITGWIALDHLGPPPPADTPVAD
jgi:hypothetical protein